MAERYQILGKLGRGGLGAIYRAHDTVMGRDVAIKRLLSSEESTANDEVSYDALKREAAALARFQHPNIVSVYSLEEDEDGPFVVTELIEGENLHNIVINGALPYDDFESIAEQALEPMIAAQKADLMHRDIKPANIMLSQLPSGKFIVKILDFGLAKFSMKPSTQTLDMKGTFLGSIDFIAPEQLELEPLDHRTDLYSLGCVLYYCLTQDSPFAGANAAETSQNHLNHRCKHLSEVRPDVPLPIANWVMHLVERNPDDRPENATVAMKELLDAQKGISPAKIRSGEKRITDSIDVVQATDSIQAAKSARKEEGEPKSGAAKRTGRVILTGPVQRKEVPVNPGTIPLSATGSVEGVGSSAKIGIIALVAIGVFAFVVWLFMTFIGEETPATSESAGLVASVPGDPSIVPVSEDKPDEPMPSPGSVALPVDESAASAVNIRVTEGLVANFQANLGAYHFDLESLSRAGQKVAAWKNLASIEPKNLVAHDYEDLQGEYLPKMGRFGRDDYPELNGMFRALHFSNRDILSASRKIGDFEKGITVMIAGRFNSTGERILRVLPKVYDGRYISLETSHSGSIQSFLRNGDGLTVDRIVEAKWPSGSLGVLTYYWNPGAESHEIRGILANGERFSSEKGDAGNTEVPFTRFAIGPRKFDVSEMAEPETLIFEILGWDRPLGDDELSAMENQLAAKYFGVKSERINLTATTAPSVPDVPPTEEPAASEGLPITEGLFEHYELREGSLFADHQGEVESEMGGLVGRWDPVSGSRNYLRPHKGKGRQVPTLVELSAEDEPLVVPGTRVLDMTEDTALAVFGIRDMAKNKGFSAFIVGKLDATVPGPFFKMINGTDNYAWAFLFAQANGIGSRIGIDADSTERSGSKLRIPEFRFSVMSYIWNGETGTRSFTVRDDRGEVYRDIEKPAFQGERNFTRFDLGTIAYGDSKIVSRGQIADFIIYKRALDESERLEVEEYLAGKFFIDP